QIRVRVEAGPAPQSVPTAGRRQRVVAAIAAFAVFALAGAFAWTALRPGSTVTTGNRSGAPPGWLVEQARSMAFNNADPTPTSAKWVLTDSKTAAPAVGLSPDQVSGAAEYLVV